MSTSSVITGLGSGPTLHRAICSILSIVFILYKVYFKSAKKKKVIDVTASNRWLNGKCMYVTGSIPSARHLFRYVTNESPKANSAFHPSEVGKWVPASAGKAKAGMVHSVSGWMRGVQVKLWNPLRTRAIPEHLRGVFTTRRYANPRLPLPYMLRHLRK